MEVGIRELRNNLSRYLDRVRAGEELVITDRGAAMARVVPMPGGRILDRLVAEGVITPADEPRRLHLRRVAARGTVSDLVVDQRR